MTEAVAAGEVNLDESVDRFDLVCKRLLEYDDAWYTMRVEENHLLFGDEDSTENRRKRAADERRYFKCFYDSFKGRDSKYIVALIGEVLTHEATERANLKEYEFVEFLAICNSAASVLGFESVYQVYFSSIHPIEAEEVERRVIESEYYDMLIEITFTLECLHRRVIMFVEEPAGMKVFEDGETRDWIKAHKKQVERERREEEIRMKKAEEAAALRLVWRQREANQIFAFMETEQKERSDIEGLQGLHFRHIASRQFTEVREARYHQKKYELLQRLLSAEASRSLAAEETTGRINLMLQQRDYHLALAADCAMSFYSTRRNVLMNELMTKERYGTEHTQLDD
ncbi:uncharacterized protein TEOVI_000823500 [Trypanosoma equiperdum]|uniref:Uncharacterized protein n=1 Tax=Trypanosoma equiperdum TaxID=5694 RepID=A0A1G4I495_TRYEQ|nr:hypothetical protein, conserved [Trypanosoma equiperdum]